MHVTAQGHLETLYTAISIKVVGSFQACTTRPKGSVGSCKYILVSRLSAVGQETSDFLVQVINGHHPIIVSVNPDSAFHFQLLVLAMSENFHFFMMLFFLLQIYLPMHVLHVYPHNLNLLF